MSTTALWLALRYFGSWRRFFSLTTSLSVTGMAIGVASLIVSMAVFSGYVSTLEKTVQDAIGHVVVLKHGSVDQSEMAREIRPLVPDLVAETPFVYAEAVLAAKGKINGIVIEGVDEATVESVLSLKNRLIAGSMNFAMSPATSVASSASAASAAPSGRFPPIAIGKGIAERFGIKVGETINIVIPLSSEFQTATFRPKLGKFRVSGIISYGRYDFDSRYVVMSLRQAQEFVEIGKSITGYRLKLRDPANARRVAQDLSSKLGSSYWARDWQEVSRNLFEAAKLEKAVLFFVLMILVIAASFNIANTLFVSVVQRYRDISILKTLGANDATIRMVFTWQGLIVGAVGALIGIALGLTLCRIFEWAQVRMKLIPPEVYKLDHINLRVTTPDLFAIVGASLLVCLVATIVPSRRGARISPVEGLRYE